MLFGMFSSSLSPPSFKERCFADLASSKERLIASFKRSRSSSSPAFRPFDTDDASLNVFFFAATSASVAASFVIAGNFLSSFPVSSSSPSSSSVSLESNSIQSVVVVVVRRRDCDVTDSDNDGTLLNAFVFTAIAVASPRVHRGIFL